MDFIPNFRVRGTVPDDLAPGQQPDEGSVNGRGDVCIAQGLPPLTDLSRLGYTMMCMQSTGVAPVSSLPTTTAAISLYNAEPSGGKCYVIDSVCLTNILSEAALTSIGVYGMINPVGVGTNPTNGLTPFVLNGRASYRGSAKIGLAVTVTNSTWFPIGSSTILTATANAMGCFEYDCKGLYVIPPTAAFNIAIVSATTVASSAIAGIRWHEVQLALG